MITIPWILFLTTVAICVLGVVFLLHPSIFILQHILISVAVSSFLISISLLLLARFFEVKNISAKAAVTILVLWGLIVFISALFSRHLAP